MSFESLRCFAAAAVLVGWLVSSSTQGIAADPTSFESADLEFFENKVRPLLAQRCYSCHSGKAKAIKGGLRLDSRVLALKGGDSGPAVSLEKPAESLLIEAVQWKSLEMPPDGKLKASELAILTSWVDRGAPWPDESANSAIPAEAGYDYAQIASEHWAYRPIEKPAVPPLADAAAAWTKNDLDHFVAQRHVVEGLSPVGPASPRHLLRRLSNDLRGLPPTCAEADQFQQDFQKSADEAVAQWVDRFLESPQYGERWARHWLDVARYSDGHGGFLDNRGLPQAWRYRDWVVQAINNDMPFRDFLRMQVAGDLIDGYEGAVATGFFALGPDYRSDGGDPDSVAQAKAETLSDRIDTLGRGLLGLTLACARCHDHKFDPLPQQDYYSLAGVFNNTRNNDTPLAPSDIVTAFNEHQAKIKNKQNEIKQLDDAAKKEKRELTDEEQKSKAAWQAELEELRKATPESFEVCHALADSGSADMKVAIRGDLRKPGAVAPRRFLRLLAGEDRATFDKGSGRLQLADAIADPSNPLAPRVFVNRVWQHHFGRGLVSTPSNFGALGGKPTHPELLDWLTATFLESGGSLKALHRVILNSATYRLSSTFAGDQFAKDGGNQWLWRMSPRRMDVESWRDSLLAVTGELDRTVGGVPTDQVNSPRRTLYFLVSRNGDQFNSDRFLRLFDFPLMRATVDQRPVSIVPQQFLFLMNSDFMVARTRAFEKRLAEEAGDQAAASQQQVKLAYLCLFNRSPTTAEQALAKAYVGEAPAEAKLTPWQQYLQVLLCSNEFMFVP